MYEIRQVFFQIRITTSLFKMSSMLAVYLSLAMLLGAELGVMARRSRSSPPHPRDNALEDDQCVLAMERVYHDHVLSPIPPDLTGEWTSKRCEARPGPEFLVRKYRFLEGDQFELHQYYYADAHCHQPTYSIVARGSINIQQPSWLVPGAMEAEYTLGYVTVMPYTDHMADLLGAKINRTCRGFVRQAWKAYEQHEIFNYVEFDANPDDSEEGYVVVDRDCTSALHLTFHELQLVRLEVRRHHLTLHKTLYLGDVHTDLAQRASYRPTSYQEPLALREKMPQNNGCPVCRLIIKSDDYYPPRLHRQHKPREGLPGEWFSSRCEVRPRGTFLSRHLIFNGHNNSWEGFYHHFSDENCREPLFSVYTRGSFILGRESPLIKNAVHFDIKVTKAKVTPRDDRILRLVKSVDGSCGEKGQWKFGIETDVTATGGCGVLSLAVPHIEFDTLKLEKDHQHTLLFLGQRPTDTTNAEILHQRPTSFQPPLIKCSEDTELSLANRVDNVGYTVVEERPRHGSAPALQLPLPLLCLAFISRLLTQ